MFYIEDGTGQGYKVKVNLANQLEVHAVSDSIQHFVSQNTGQAYQVSTTATLSSGTVVSLHVTNNSATENLVVTYIRHQIIDPSGGAAFPNASNYFRIALGRTYASGGAEITPINLNQASGNVADVACYNSGPVLAGTALEIDRWYTKAEGDMNTFNKEGSIILQTNQTLELSYIGDQSGGTIYSRLSFLMRVPT